MIVKAMTGLIAVKMTIENFLIALIRILTTLQKKDATEKNRAMEK